MLWYIVDVTSMESSVQNEQTGVGWDDRTCLEKPNYQARMPTDYEQTW